MHLRHLRLCFFFYSGNHWTTKVPICESVLSKHFIRRLLYQDVSDKCIDVIEYKLHRNLTKTLEWMNKNNLTISLKKTKCVVVGTEQRLRNCRNFSTQVEIFIIENVSCVKLLRVCIDKCLTWSEHVDILLEKTCK